MYFNNPNLLSQIDTHTHTHFRGLRERSMLLYFIHQKSNAKLAAEHEKCRISPEATARKL